MVEQLKKALKENKGKKIAGGSVGVVAILTLIYTIFIAPLNAKLDTLDNYAHTNKEKNIEQDGKLENQRELLKRIDDNVKKLLNKL